MNDDIHKTFRTELVKRLDMLHVGMESTGGIIDFVINELSRWEHELAVRCACAPGEEFECPFHSEIRRERDELREQLQRSKSE